MEIAVGRSLRALPSRFSAFPSNGIGGKTSPVKTAPCRRQCRNLVVRAQQRPTWLPGLDPPPYLDGTWAPFCQFTSFLIGCKCSAAIDACGLLFAVLLGISGLILLDLERIRKAWGGMCKQSWFMPVSPWLGLQEFFLLMWAAKRTPMMFLNLDPCCCYYDVFFFVLVLFRFTSWNCTAAVASCDRDKRPASVVWSRSNKIWVCQYKNSHCCSALIDGVNWQIMICHFSSS